MDLLQVDKNQIVDRQGRPVYLRGVGVGGWMNMEEFIGCTVVRLALQPEFARCFAGRSETEIDRGLSSFSFDACRPHQALLNVVQGRLDSEKGRAA